MRFQHGGLVYLLCIKIHPVLPVFGRFIAMADFSRVCKDIPDYWPLPLVSLALCTPGQS